MNNIPKSVSIHLAESNANLWTLPNENIDWNSLDLNKINIVSGSAFIDINDPYGSMGNPFTVIIGNDVKNIGIDRRREISQKTGTPETIFINEYSSSDGGNKYELNLTVYTPSGKELGACAHGFTGAIKTMLDLGLFNSNSQVTISTTLNTSAEVSISADSVISLQFKSEKPQEIKVSSQKLHEIFRTQIVEQDKVLPVLSVGSPKLIIELSPEIFTTLQQNLNNLDYDKLLAFEEELHINGVHLFCRNKKTDLPERCIQVNAYLGKNNMADPATGVSNAAQISADEKVARNQEVKITQYTQKGPSARLQLTKRANNIVDVGGTAILFNYNIISL